MKTFEEWKAKLVDLMSADGFVSKDFATQWLDALPIHQAWEQYQNDLKFWEKYHHLTGGPHGGL